ncbi:MAG TPA: hypothetical protein VII61_23350, partial [Ktedonobacteraceae bacterium]
PYPYCPTFFSLIERYWGVTCSECFPQKDVDPTIYTVQRIIDIVASKGKSIGNIWQWLEHNLPWHGIITTEIYS